MLRRWSTCTGHNCKRCLHRGASAHGVLPSCTLHCRAHGVSPSYPVQLDTSGSSLSEGMLRGLDYFLAEAGKRGLKV